MLNFSARLLRVRGPDTLRESSHPLARFAPEIAIAAMCIVVSGFALLAIGNSRLLLTLLPLLLFVLATQPELPRGSLAWGLLGTGLVGLLTASPQIVTLSFFPLGFFGLLAIRGLALGLREGFGALLAPARRG